MKIQRVVVSTPKERMKNNSSHRCSFSGNFFHGRYFSIPSLLFYESLPSLINTVTPTRLCLKMPFQPKSRLLVSGVKKLFLRPLNGRRGQFFIARGAKSIDFSKKIHSQTEPSPLQENRFL